MATLYVMPKGKKAEREFLAALNLLLKVKIKLVELKDYETASEIRLFERKFLKAPKLLKASKKLGDKNKTNVNWKASLDKEQFEKFTDFLSWLKKDIDIKPKPSR